MMGKNSGSISLVNIDGEIIDIVEQKHQLDKIGKVFILFDEDENMETHVALDKIRKIMKEGL